MSPTQTNLAGRGDNEDDDEGAHEGDKDLVKDDEEVLPIGPLIYDEDLPIIIAEPDEKVDVSVIIAF